MIKALLGQGILSPKFVQIFLSNDLFLLFAWKSHVSVGSRLGHE